jgi:hypothetical protein
MPAAGMTIATSMVCRSGRSPIPDIGTVSFLVIVSAHL